MSRPNDGCSRCKLRLRGLELSKSICFSCAAQIRAGNEALEIAARKCEELGDKELIMAQVHAYGVAAREIRALKATFDDPPTLVPQ